MKMKRWYLYVIATLCFLLTFTTLNLKYDRFYRVNGIDNDNRSLIEKYLDDKEQEYLIDHGITVKDFIEYIEYEQFNLEYYEYYNELKEAKKYHSIENLLNDVNGVVDRLTVEFKTSASKHYKILIKNDLFYAYQQSSYFDFDNVKYYQLLRTLYNEDDYRYIVLTNSYVDVLKEENGDTYQLFKDMINTYDANALYVLMSSEINENARRLYSFDMMSQVINETTFIGGYEAKHMTMIENIDRLSYSMYLHEAAYDALKQMYDDVYKATNSRFIVTSTYRSYDVLKVEYGLLQAGYSEFQLGTSIALKVNGIKEADFSSTDVFKWLEEHSYEYGYILRYPQDKQAITNISNNNVFRYVGKDIAKKLHDENLCLEEYQQE